MKFGGSVDGSVDGVGVGVGGCRGVAREGGGHVGMLKLAADCEFRAAPSPDRSNIWREEPGDARLMRALV